MRILLRRLLHLLVVLFFVTLFVALLTSMLPGDPVDAIAGFASEEQKEELRTELGLDDPLPMRYGRWISDFVTGDLGNYYSISGSRPVMDRVSDSLPVSLQLMLYAQVLALAVAIPAGVISAYRAGSLGDAELRSYAADGRGYVYFLLDAPELDRQTLVRTDQVALEIYWRAPDRMRQRIVGMRQQKELPVTRLYYYLDRLTVAVGLVWFASIIVLGLLFKGDAS